VKPIQATCTAIFLLIGPQPSGAQVDALTLGGVLAALGPTIDDAIEKAGNEGNYVVFRAASEVKLVIEALRLAGDDLLEKSFSELNNSQQNLFQNLQQLNQDFDANLTSQITEIRASVDQIQQISNDWRFADPTVLRVGPDVLAPKDSGEFFISVQGLSLDRANPQIAIYDAPMSRVSLTQNEAVFVVPADHFNFDQYKTELWPSIITLSYEVCGWLGWLSGCEIETVEFETAFMTLPKIVAQVEVSSTRLEETRVFEANERYNQFGYSTGDQTRRKCRKFTQSPHAPNWFIDVDSIVSRSVSRDCPANLSSFLSVGMFATCPQTGKYNEPAQFGRNGSASIREKTATGFVVEACAKGYMSGLTPKSGERRINVFWREYKLEDARVDNPSNNGDLEWGRFLEWQYPLKTEAVSVSVRTFDGRVLPFTGNGSDKFISVDWNAGTKQLVIRAKQPSDVQDLN